MGTALDSRGFAFPSKTSNFGSMSKIGHSRRTLTPRKLIENKFSEQPRGNSRLRHKKIYRFSIPNQKSAGGIPSYVNFRVQMLYFAPAVDLQPWSPRGKLFHSSVASSPSGLPELTECSREPRILAGSALCLSIAWHAYATCKHGCAMRLIAPCSLQNIFRDPSQPAPP